MLELMLTKPPGAEPANITTANIVYAVKRVYTTNLITANVIVATRKIRPPNVIRANVVLATRRK